MRPEGALVAMATPFRSNGAIHRAMLRRPKQLLAEALQLPPEQRAALAGELIQSLDSQIDEDAEAAWSAEIRRRLERLDSGSAKTVPWSQAPRRILAAARR